MRYKILTDPTNGRAVVASDPEGQELALMVIKVWAVDGGGNRLILLENGLGKTGGRMRPDGSVELTPVEVLSDSSPELLPHQADALRTAVT